MTREKFEFEVEEIKQMMLNFYFISDKGQRRNYQREILFAIKQLLKV